MKRITKIGVVLLTILMVVSLAACGGGSASDDKDSAAGDGETIIVATDTTFAPFEFENDDGEFVGIDMDLLKAIAEDQDIQYEVKVLGFNAALQALESGQADAVMAGMSITEERKNKFDFSDPYFDSGVGMAVSKDNEDIKSYEDLNGQTVAVKTGTEGAAFAESIAEQYGFEMTTYEDSANMYESVKSGHSVACFEDYPVLGYAITQGQPLKMIGELEAGNSYGVGVRKGENEEFLKKFNAGLKNLKESGKYDEILDTYITK